jgi:hypothetical protein
MARALVWALFAMNVYRAATQSITADEAFACGRFVVPPMRDILAQYHAGNHVLYTLLAKMSVAVFRVSEFSLRLPSLLCGGLYLWAAYRLARRTFGAGALFLAAVALLALNPLVLDHLSAARGYGMALAFWMWALELMLEGNLTRSALCLGLSAAANLAFVFPAAALAMTFLLALALRREWNWDDLTGRFLIPGAVTAFVLLAIPLNRAEPGNFTYGASSLRQTLQALTAISLFHDPEVPSILGLDVNPGAALKFLAPVMRIALGALALIAVYAAAQILRRREQGRVESLVVLTGGTMVLVFAALVLARRRFGLPYPLDRTALYWIPLASLAALALVSKLHWRPALGAALVLSGLLASQYLCEFNLWIYGEWPEDAGAKSLVRILRRDAGNRRIRIGASPALEPVLNFYRARYRLAAWEPVERKPLTGTFDYYVLTLPDAGLADERHLRVLYRDSGLVLAR